ncbi:DUF3783 domain-containing protein [Anaerosporobacter sp.]|uniref:DUF3783 domain-containing protein n=1 Tax=Anaerosporobacter sp. TaxID=1872529 RepID=UPI002896A6EA|nr:DUF3783 domain-containing protein [Anaerosporobacter sp.]
MEKILLFQSKEATNIRKIAAPMHIKVVEVEVSQFKQTLGKLAGYDKEEEDIVYEGEAPEGSLMVFCDFTENHFNTMLQKMRAAKIPMTYKAVMTAVNRTWDVFHMYEEMEMERKAYENRK